MRHHLRSLFRFARTLKGTFALGISSFLLIVGMTMAKAPAQSAGAVPITQEAAIQIQSLVQEKWSRTPAQRKIRSSLLYTIKAKGGNKLFERIPQFNTFVKLNSQGEARVNIQTNVQITPELLEKIKATDSKILFSWPEYKAIQAFVPLTQVESIAMFQEVSLISPYIQPMLSGGTIAQKGELLKSNDPSPASQVVSGVKPVREPLAELPSTEKYLAQVQGEPITNAGSVSSEGDIAHGAALARSTYGVNGSWTKNVGGTIRRHRVKIGVISDSYNNLGGAATDIANGDLPPEGVTLVGSGDIPKTSPDYPGTDEGRAMLQIIHDLAPGARLYFATASSTQREFASNIRALRKAGCDIIVDDVGYSTEPVLQDGIVAQAVNDVTADGALYFSAAGNSGNKDDSTSGVWSGDFVDGGAAPLGISGRVHSFGSTLSDTITQNTGQIVLQWSDPWGQSLNDYDLYVLNRSGRGVVAASTDFQTGNSNPLELVNPQSIYSQVIVVQYDGAQRFLHLNTNRGRLAINTRGQTSGHSAAVNAFSVAAVNAQGRTTLFTGGAANPVEVFSSDGPRRIFYNADGTPVTPGNFLSSGGVLRQKPDIAAADGVKTSVTNATNPSFNPFFGTSAAAPHAAGVAALLKSFRPALTPAQIRSILTSTALDIEAPGVDQDSGYGIVMANRALQKAAQMLPGGS